jgi:DNA segregation ATPase FtsK/SpoIIIE, S-DNA-T family
MQEAMRKKNRTSSKNTFKPKSGNDNSKKNDLKGNEFTLKKFFASFKDQRLRKIFGLLLVIIAFYLFLSFSSYLVNWKTDDSLINDRTFNIELLGDTQIKAQNLMGRLGAITAHLFIKKWFGVSSFLFSLMFFVVGFKLMTRISVLPLWKTLRYSFFTMIWLSVALGFIFTRGEGLLLGGTFGYQSNIWLNGILGKVGTGFIILFALASFLIVVFNINTYHYRMLMDLLRGSDKKKADDELVIDENDETSENEQLPDVIDEYNEDDKFEEEFDSETAILERIRQRENQGNENDEFFEYDVAENGKR